MGELEITICDLNSCPSCDRNNPMMIQDEKSLEWYISCGYRKCYHKTDMHEELLDACDEWGLKAQEE